MTIEQVVRDRLVDDADVSALVGTRVYQLILPQPPMYPAIRVQLIGELENYHLRGTVKLFRARVQVDSYAGPVSGVDSKAIADSLATAVNASLSGARFYDGGSPTSIKVTGIFRKNRAPSFESDEFHTVCVMQDYMVHFETMT